MHIDISPFVVFSNSNILSFKKEYLLFKKYLTIIVESNFPINFSARDRLEILRQEFHHVDPSLQKPTIEQLESYLQQLGLHSNKIVDFIFCVLIQHRIGFFHSSAGHIQIFLTSIFPDQLVTAETQDYKITSITYDTDNEACVI